MAPPSWAVLALAWLAALSLLSKLINLHRRGHHQKLPPGPNPWPIIGNLNLIGSIPHQSFHMLSQKYGQIMQLKLGSFPVVVASSPEMAKQFLKTHGQTFASRPATAAGKYTSYNFSDMTWAPYGPYWRQARRIYLNELFSPKQLDSYEYIRVEERHALISRIHALSGKNIGIAIKEHLIRFTLTTVSRMAFGDKYLGVKKSESSAVKPEELQAMFDEWFLLNGVFNIGDWIPWLNFLDLQGYVKRMKALYKKLDKFHDYVINDHKARREEEKDGFVAKDMVDVVLQLADDPNIEVELNSDCVKGLLQVHSTQYILKCEGFGLSKWPPKWAQKGQHNGHCCVWGTALTPNPRRQLDPIAGGTDTSAITLEWAISELLKHPQLLKKATEELDRVIGRERWVEEKDTSQLPYIDAIVKETMRLHPPATLLAPHYSIEDCSVAGYDIPKGTTVFINVWSIGRDPKYWDDPEEFRPERFVGKEIDVKGQHFELLPFGSGRRMCPAYTLGLKLVRSTLANLLHGFKLKLPENMKPEDVDMEEEYGLTTHRKIPIVVVTEPRLAARLYY